MCIPYVCMYVGVPVGVCTCSMLVWVHVWVYYECVLIPLPFCVFGCVLQCFGFVRWDSDSLQKIRTRFRFVPVMDPIHRRFENQSMGWFVDQYWFVQWDQTSIQSETASFHVSVCSYVIFFFTIIVFYSYYFMWLHIIFYQFGLLYHFMRHYWLSILIV